MAGSKTSCPKNLTLIMKRLAKKYVVIRETTRAVFHLLLLGVTAVTTVTSSHLRELLQKSLVSRSYSQRGCFQRPNLIKKSIAILWKKNSNNSATVKAEFLVKDKRILNLIRKLFWSMPWIHSEVHCYSSSFLIVFMYSIISWNIN